MVSIRKRKSIAHPKYCSTRPVCVFVFYFIFAFTSTLDAPILCVCVVQAFQNRNFRRGAECNLCRILQSEKRHAHRDIDVDLVSIFSRLCSQFSLDIQALLSTEARPTYDESDGIDLHDSVEHV